MLRLINFWYNIDAQGENLMASSKISELIKNRRKELGLSMEDVAKNVGVNRSTICRWESGDIKTLKRSHVYFLSKILYVPVDAVLGFETNNLEDAELVKLKLLLKNKIDTIKSKENCEHLIKYITTFFNN
jgi:transcriptional regulator with XRE-family HTH domain